MKHKRTRVAIPIVTSGIMLFSCFLCVFLFSGKSILADTVTHMPDEVEPTLAPDVKHLMKNLKVNKPCQERINTLAQKLLKDFETKHRNFSIPIHPCDQCKFDGSKTFHVPKGAAKTARYDVKGILIDIKAQFRKFKVICKSCHIVDDSKKVVSGDINAAWTNGKLDLLFLKHDEHNHDDMQYLIVNATNVNKKTVKVDCLGSKAFKSACRKTHQSGELDHVFQHSVDHVFVVDEDSLLANAFGDVQNGKSFLSIIFACFVNPKKSG